MLDLSNKKLIKEWQKIKNADIFPSIEKFAEFYYENGEKSCYRITTSEPWSKDNFFFGDYQELLDYYKFEFPKRRIGQKHFSLTILDVFLDQSDGKDRWYAKCRCDCGRTTIKLLDSIKDGNSRTCGCKNGKGFSKEPETKKELQYISNTSFIEYWDYEKNHVSPEKVLENSTEEFWWNDNSGNSFKLAPFVFYKPNTSTSFPEQALFYYIKKHFPFTINKAQYITHNGEIIEIDIYIPSLHIGIEYDGSHWHANRVESDISKNTILNEDDIYVIRVREEGLEKLPQFFGKTIIRSAPTYKNDTLVKAINSVFLTIKKFLQSSQTFKKISLEDFERDANDIYALLFTNPVEESVYDSSLIEFWDYKKNASLNPKFLPCGNDSVKVHFKCKKGFEVSLTSQRAFKSTTDNLPVVCALSSFCEEYNRKQCKCDIFKHDLLLRCIVSERQFNTQKGYPCCYYITDDELFSLISNKDSYIYSSGLEYEQILRFFCLCSVDYNMSSFLSKDVFEFVYREVINSPNINASDFFESVRHLLKTEELHFMLENDNICKLLLNSFGIEYAMERLLKTNKGFFRFKVYSIARNFVLIANHLTQNDLSNICSKIEAEMPLYEFEYFLAEVRMAADKYLGKGIIKTDTIKMLELEFGSDFLSAKTEQEKTEHQIQQKAFLALEQNENAKELLREAIASTFCPRKERFIYELYKKGYLNEIGDEFRLNGSGMAFPTMDFSFVTNPHEILDMMEIIGMMPFNFNLLDFDKDGLRDRFISVAKRSFDADWAMYIYARGFNVKHFAHEIDKHINDLSVEFIEKLLVFLSYVSSPNDRPSSGYTKINADIIIFTLKTRLNIIKPSNKTSIKKPSDKTISSVSVATLPGIEIKVTPEQTKQTANGDSSNVTQVKQFTPPKKASQSNKQNNHKPVSAISKTKKTKVKHKNIISNAVIIIFVILLIALILFFGGKKTSIPQSSYDDLTNHSSVRFVINDDNASYTMERKYDFPFPKKPPEIIVIPETFEGKPITIWDGIFSEYNIIEVVGSKNLEKICNEVFADKTDVSHMKLEKVIFPKDGNLKSVGRWAFFNNDKLHTVIVPQNFESFGVGAFYSCASLSTLVIYNKIPPSGADGLFNDGYNDRFFYKPTVPFTVYVPDDAVETYKESSWGQYNIRPISEFIQN